MAGNGETPFSGDGDRRRRPASTARQDWPWTTKEPSTSRTPATGASGGSHRTGSIETIAGTGEAASSGDGGPATEAAIGGSGSLLLDDAGNLYVGDPDGNRIRVISPDGIITTFAGTGEAGYGGDGGPATEATFRLAGDPASLAIDASGNVYIGDSGNHVIRVVDPSGVISTLEVGS